MGRATIGADLWRCQFTLRVIRRATIGARCWRDIIHRCRLGQYRDRQESGQRRRCCRWSSHPGISLAPVEHLVGVDVVLARDHRHRRTGRERRRHDLALQRLRPALVGPRRASRAHNPFCGHFYPRPPTSISAKARAPTPSKQGGPHRRETSNGAANGMMMSRVSRTQFDGLCCKAHSNQNLELVKVQRWSWQGPGPKIFGSNTGSAVRAHRRVYAHRCPAERRAALTPGARSELTPWRATRA